MASTYVSTLLNSALYKASQKDGFQTFETRGSVYGALDAAWSQRNDLLPATTIETLKKSSVQVVNIDVFKKEDAGTGTARKCSGSGKGATARIPLTWSTIIEEFEMSDLDFAQNNFNKEEIFQNRFEQRMLSIYTRLDTAITAFLESNYTQGSGDNFTFYNNASQVPLDSWSLAANQAAFWVNDAMADMFKNDLNADLIRMVGDANMMGVWKTLGAQGPQNGVNTAFQLAGINGRFTNRIANNTGIKATAYMYEQGMFSLLTWINALEKKGRDIGTDEWTMFKDTRYGFDIGMKVKRECVDNSADIDGAQADFKESFVMALDYATPIAYSSDSNSGIYKFELDRDNSILSGSGSYV